MESRRSFLKKATAATALTMLPSMSLLAKSSAYKKITILHTNDQHSRIEPFETSSNPKLSNKGGFARRSELIQNIRQQEKNVLLLDAGDVFQGTPYFNLYGGELEYKLMSKMGYDASTLGNHEFDNALAGLKKQLPHAQFEILSSNYDFSNTVLEGVFQPYKVFVKDGVRIGIFGLGVDLEGLVAPNSYLETKYLDPIEITQDMTRILKQDKKCDLIICLSHIGYDYKNDPSRVSDIHLAQKTADIDLIIGGHTHTFLTEPQSFINTKGQTVLVNQVGWAGLYLGRIDFHMKEGKLDGYTTYNLETLSVSELV